MMKKTIGILLGAGIVAGILYLLYQRLDEPHKRFVRELARQAPFLIPRYYV